MNNETVMRMAREAGLEDWAVYGRIESKEQCLERFAALVAAAEREECAEFLMRGVDLAGLAGDPVMQKYTVELLIGLSTAIRARLSDAKS